MKLKKIVPFKESKYLTQVRRLRNLAVQALKKYNLQVKKIEFINHGENATFKVSDKKGKAYLLRIHRGDYHTTAAIQEELQWLAKLGKEAKLSIPRPLKSKTGELLIEVTNLEVGTRQCCLFKWLPGRFIEKSLNPKQMYQLGQMIAHLHQAPPKTKHRHYWNAGGLVGPSPKFGSLKNLHSVTPQQQKKILRASQIVFKKLKRFEKKYPNRMGLIHADLHFRNVLLVDNKIGAIDFDDCGHGFFAYDILIPLISAEGILGKKGKKKFPALKKALIDGYKTGQKWDQADDEILEYLKSARKLTMLGWLNSRSDNPRLKKYMKKAVKSSIEHIDTAEHL